MEGKVFGIPFILILLVVAIGVVVNVPAVLLNVETQRQLRALNTNQINTSLQLRGLRNAVANRVASQSATIVPTVPATPTPTRTFFRPTAVPTK